MKGLLENVIITIHQRVGERQTWWVAQFDKFTKMIALLLALSQLFQHLLLNKWRKFMLIKSFWNSRGGCQVRICIYSIHSCWKLQLVEHWVIVYRKQQCSRWNLQNIVTWHPFRYLSLKFHHFMKNVDYVFWLVKFILAWLTIFYKKYVI